MNLPGALNRRGRLKAEPRAAAVSLKEKLLIKHEVLHILLPLRLDLSPGRKLTVKLRTRRRRPRSSFVYQRQVSAW